MILITEIIERRFSEHQNIGTSTASFIDQSQVFRQICLNNLFRIS